jgi:hypothetical protein
MLRRSHSGAGQRWSALESLDFRHRQCLSPLACDGWFGTTAVTAASCDNDRGTSRSSPAPSKAPSSAASTSLTPRPRLSPARRSPPGRNRAPHRSRRSGGSGSPPTTSTRRPPSTRPIPSLFPSSTSIRPAAPDGRGHVRPPLENAVPSPLTSIRAPHTPKNPFTRPSSSALTRRSPTSHRTDIGRTGVWISYPFLPRAAPATALTRTVCGANLGPWR